MTFRWSNSFMQAASRRKSSISVRVQMATDGETQCRERKLLHIGRGMIFFFFFNWNFKGVVGFWGSTCLVLLPRLSGTAWNLQLSSTSSQKILYFPKYLDFLCSWHYYGVILYLGCEPYICQYFLQAASSSRFSLKTEIFDPKTCEPLTRGGDPLQNSLCFQIWRDSLSPFLLSTHSSSSWQRLWGPIPLESAAPPSQSQIRLKKQIKAQTRLGCGFRCNPDEMPYSAIKGVYPLTKHRLSHYKLLQYNWGHSILVSRGNDCR